MASIALQQIVKDYGQIRAVDGIDLEIEDGEFVAFVGPSGCGKSTLLRMIAGLEEITEGTALIGDRVVNAIEPRGRDVAMVFQDYALYPHMSVEKNIGFGLKMRGVQETETTRRVKEAAQMLQIEQLLQRKPAELSGGQRQRVAMGRAIVRKPAVFLFDEPLSNLDAKLRVDMRTQIKRLHSILKTTMIYVTHDQIEAMTLADRIVLLRDGRIEQQGKPIDLYTTPRNRFVAEFIGSPQMNLLDAGMAEEQGKAVVQIGEQLLPINPIAIDNQSGPDDILVGIRPEHFALAESGGNFQVSVVLIEPTGSDTLVLCSIENQELTVRLPADYPVEVGQSLRLSVSANRIHIFNKNTGERFDMV